MYRISVSSEPLKKAEAPMITTFDELVDDVIAKAQEHPMFQDGPDETIWETSYFIGEHLTDVFDFDAIVAEARKRFPEAKGVYEDTLTWPQLDELKAKIRPGTRQEDDEDDEYGYWAQVADLLRATVVHQVDVKLNLHSV